LGLLILRGISSTGPFGHAKMYVINAFGTSYLLFTGEVMAKILHLAQSVDEELLDSDMTTPAGPTSPICDSHIPRTRLR
jgi:hypothetical protein